MILEEQFGPVTQLRMGRDMDGQVLYWVAAYLVDGLLIDTGCHFTAGELADYLSGKDLKSVFVTHYHEDHIGGCAALQNKFDLPLYAGQKSLPLIKVTPKLYSYQELVWGYPEAADYEVLAAPEIKTEHYLFKVVETPGHSIDHLVLIEESQGWCFSGDLFVSENIKVLRPEENISQIMNSMHKLLKLFSDQDSFNNSGKMTLFTSIGKVIPAAHVALRNCLSYLEDKALEVRRLQDNQGLSTEEIVLKIFGAESTMADITDGQFTTKNLVNSLLTDL